MSKTIDERVVEMRFDNSRFEKNVQDTIDQLEQLKKSLKFEETSDGLDGMVSKLGSIKSKISSGFKGVFSGLTNAMSSLKSRLTSGSSGIFSGFNNMLDSLKNKLSFGKNSGLSNLATEAGMTTNAIGQMGNALDGVKVKFSALQVVGATILSNLTNSAMGFVKNGISSALNQIKTGGWKRASDLEQARFSLEGILKDGKNVEEVLKNAADSVDGTAYALNSAALAASQFAASGIQAGTQMERALSGVAGIAATTNSDYDSIAHIFTTVAGNGKLMTMQLNQLSLRGMNAAASLTDYFNKVNDGSVTATDAVKKSVLEMTKGKKITEGELRDLVTKGKISFDVFSEAMATTFGDQAGKANETFTGSMANIRAALSRTGQMFFTGYGQVDEFGNEFKGIVDAGSSVVEMFNSVRLMLNRLNKDFTDSKIGVAFQKDADAIAKAVKTFVTYIDTGTYDAKGNLQSTAGFFTKIAQAIMNFVAPIKVVVKAISDAFQTIWNNNDKTHNIWHTIWQLGDAFLRLSEIVKKYAEHSLKNLTDVFVSMFSVFRNIGRIIKAVVTPLRESFDRFFGSIDGRGISILKVFQSALSWVADRLVLTGYRANQLSSIIFALMSVLKLITVVLKGLFTIFKPILSLFGLFVDITADSMVGASGSIAEFTETLAEALAKTDVFDKIAARVQSFVDKIRKPIEFVRNLITTVFQWIRDLGLAIGEEYRSTGNLINSFWSGLEKMKDTNPFTAIINGAKVFRNEITEAKKTWTKFSDSYNFGANMSTWGKGLTGGGKLGGVLSTVEEGAWRIVTVFSSAYKAITGKDISDKIESFWQSNIDNIMVKLYGGLRKAQTIIEDFFRAISLSYGEGGEGLGGIVEIMFDGLVGGLRGISTLIKKFTGKDFTGVVNEAIAPALQGARNSVVEFIDKMKETHPTIAAISDGIKNVVDKVVAWMKALKNGKGVWSSVDPSFTFASLAKNSEKTKRIADALDKVYLSIKNFGAKATPVAKAAFAKLGDAFNSVKNYISDKGLATKVKKSFDATVKALKNAATKVKSAYSKVSKAFKSGWSSFKKVADPTWAFIKSVALKLKDAFSVLRANVATALSNADFSKPIEVIKGFFKGLSDTVPTIIDAIVDFGKKIIDGFKSLFGKDEVFDELDGDKSEFQKFSDELAPVADTLKATGDNLGNAMATVNDAFKKTGKNASMADVLAKFASGFKAFTDMMKPVVSFITSVGKKFAPSFKAFGDAFTKAVGNMDINGMAALLKSGGLFIIADALSRYIKNLLKLKKGAKQAGELPPLLDQLTGGFFKSAKSFFTKAEKSLKLGTVIAFGVAIGIIAGAIVTIGSMNAGDAVQGSAIIMIVFRQLFKVMQYAGEMAKHEKDIMKFGSFATRMGISLRVFASAIKTIGKLDPGGAILGTAAIMLILKALTKILDMFSGMVKKMSVAELGTLTSLLEYFKGFAISIAGVAVIMAFAIKTIAKLDTGKAVQGIFGVVAIIGALTGLAYVLGKLASSMSVAQLGTFTSLMDFFADFALHMTVAVLGFAIAMNILGKLEWGQMARSLSAMGFALAMMVGALAVLSMLTFEGIGADFAAGAIVAMAGAMLIFAVAVRVLAPALGDLAEGLKKFAGVKLSSIGKALALFGGFAVVGFIAAAAFYVLSAACLQLAIGVAPLGVALLEVAAAVVIFAVGVGLMFTAISTGILKFVGVLAVLDKVKNLDRKLNKFKDAISEFAKAAVKLGLAALVFAIGIAVLAAAVALAGVASLIFGAAVSVIAFAAAKLAGALSLLAIGLQKFGDAVNYISNLEGLTDGLTKFVKVLHALMKTAGVMALLGLGALVLGAGLIFLGVGLALVVGPLAGIAIAIAKVATAMAIISKIAPDALGKLKDTLTVVINAIGKFIADYILIIPKLISGVLKGLAASAGEILANLEAVFNEFVGPVVDMVMDLIDSILGALDEHMDSFVEKGSSALQKFMDGMSNKADGLVESAYNMCMSFLQAFDKYIPQFADKGFDVIISIVDGISDAIDKKAPELRAAIVRLKESIVNGIKTIFGAGDAQSETKGAVGGAVGGGAREALESDDTDYSTGANWLETRIINAVEGAFFGADADAKDAEGGKTGKGLLDSLTEWGSSDKFQGAMDTMVSSAISALKNSVANYVETKVPLLGGTIGKLFKKHAAEGAEETGKAAGKHAEKAKAAVEKGKTSLETAASGYKGAIAKGVNSGSGNITGAIDSVVKPAKNKADDYKNNFQNVGRHWMEFAAKAVKAAGSANVTPAVKSVGKSAKNAADAYKSNFQNVGRHWMQGLTRGINAEGEKAVAAAKKVADQVKQITASSWDSHSPSRVADSLGRFWSTGLGNGILALASYVRKASQKTAYDAVDELVGAVAYASDYVSTASTEYTPSITPVLDMANVRQGAYDISNMLYAAQSAGLANGMSNQFNANSYEEMNAEMRVDNSDVVRAVRSLNGEIEDLKSTVKNLRMVMDTGAIVGELRDPMDRALGMKSRHISRGG